ncbi:MAG TPA: ester cyclase [Crinalium sp.]|jgi:steroid delta-isomerase-like uncharacterized protein
MAEFNQSEFDQFELNKSVAQRFYDIIWNQKNLDALDDLLTSDYVWHEPSTVSDLQGVPRARQFLLSYFTAFPDYQVVIDDIISEDDRVAVRWTAYGTHQGPLKGIPPTGKSIKLPGISILRIREGKCSEYWTSLDNFLLLSELGIFKK